jgi:hypothetical protein
MRLMVSSLGLLLLMGSFGIAQPQQRDSYACGFTVQGEPTHPTVAGPDDIVPIVYVVEQPDSPIEIVSIDLQEMWLSISKEQHTEQDCAKYKVRNRSDRVIQGFDIELLVSGISGGGGSGAHSSSPLAPGQTVEIMSCGGGGHGGAAGNHVRLLVSVHSVDFGDCLYRASLRIPRSLGVHPVWWVCMLRLLGDSVQESVFTRIIFGTQSSPDCATTRTLAGWLRNSLAKGEGV